MQVTEAVCYSGPLHVLQLTVLQFVIGEPIIYCRLQWQFRIADRFMYCKLHCCNLV
jgi:hypothetical protein